MGLASLCFVDFLKSEEAREQIVLIVDGPVGGKAKAFSQPQHRLETRHGSSRGFEGLEAADFRHARFHNEMVALNALLKDAR